MTGDDKQRRCSILCNALKNFLMKLNNKVDMMRQVNTEEVEIEKTEKLFIESKH
jgi:hypothetical protein